MPYRHAYLFVLAIFPLAGLAFWRGYLSTFASASPEFHAHGITATLWVMLLAAQSWTIHNGQRAAHRVLGVGSLALFPLFLAGGSAIFIGMADRFVAAETPFHAMYAPRLAWLDVVSVAGFAWFYFEGLRTRTQVQAHARWMLATTIFLLPPIFGRLAPAALPMLQPTGLEDFWKLGVGFQLANVLTAVIAFALALHSGKHGRPFAAAGVLTVLSALFYQFVGGTGSWRSLFGLAAELPWAPVALAAAAGGVAVAAAGWMSGGRGRIGPRRRELTAAAS